MELKRLLMRTIACAGLFIQSALHCMEKQYAIPGKTLIERKQALASLGIDVSKMRTSNAYILGAIDPSIKLSDADMLVLLALEENSYALPGDTPEERLAAFNRIGGNIRLLTDSEKSTLGLLPVVNPKAQQQPKETKQVIPQPQSATQSQKQYAIPGKTWTERKLALASLGIDVNKMPTSNAYILGAIDPSVQMGDADMLVLVALEQNRYVLPGDTPEKRLAALKKIGGNIAVLTNSEKSILGLVAKK